LQADAGIRLRPLGETSGAKAQKCGAESPNENLSMKPLFLEK